MIEIRKCFEMEDKATPMGVRCGAEGCTSSEYRHTGFCFEHLHDKSLIGCPYCNKNFSTFSHMQQHSKDKHGKEIQDSKKNSAEFAKKGNPESSKNIRETEPRSIIGSAILIIALLMYFDAQNGGNNFGEIRDFAFFIGLIGLWIAIPILPLNPFEILDGLGPPGNLESQNQQPGSFYSNHSYRCICGHVQSFDRPQGRPRCPSCGKGMLRN